MKLELQAVQVMTITNKPIFSLVHHHPTRKLNYMNKKNSIHYSCTVSIVQNATTTVNSTATQHMMKHDDDQSANHIYFPCWVIERQSQLLLLALVPIQAMMKLDESYMCNQCSSQSMIQRSPNPLQSLGASWISITKYQRILLDRFSKSQMDSSIESIMMISDDESLKRNLL